MELKVVEVGVARLTRICAVVLCVLAAPAMAAAQETRAALIAAEQEKRAAALSPPVPSRGEQVFIRLRETILEEPGGFFPTFESVYSGGGFTLGAGYRKFVGDNTFIDVKGIFTVKAYKKLETGITSSQLADGRMIGRVYGGWRDATQVAYHGLGIDTTQDDRTNFRFHETYAAGDFDFRPIPWIVVGAGIGYQHYAMKSGKGSYPSIEEVYSEATAPGLASSPDYLHTRASAALDWRTSPGYSRRGGLYGVTLHNYVDLDDTYSFDQVQVDLVQHIPIMRETWVVSVRGRLQTTIGDDSNTPVFLLPSLGGGSTLRGYSSWRFRDQHAVLTSAEFRWIPNRLALDFALFYDGGHVAATRSALSLGEFKSNWGVGARFHSALSTPLRIELARGTEGFQLVFGASAAF